jgi:type IV fimbrial biogenesis protein FimT
MIPGTWSPLLDSRINTISYAFVFIYQEIMKRNIEKARPLRAVYSPLSAINGMTLVELLVAISVLALLMGVGLPSILDILEQRRVSAAAEAVRAHLIQARAHAVLRGQDVVMSYRPGDPAQWAIGYRQNTLCDPTQTETQHPLACLAIHGGPSITTVLQAVSWPDVALRANRTHTRFEGLSGLAPGSNLSLRLEGIRGRRVHVILNTAGRVRACSPQGAAKVGRYPDC